MQRKRTVEIEALREEIKAKVSAIPDTNFMWCVNYYFAEFPTKSKFENSNFFREFEFDNNLQDLLEQYFRLTPFTEFRTSLRQMSKQIIEEKIESDDTSLLMRSWLTNYVPASKLKQMCEANPKNRNNVFMYLFKLLEPFFLYSSSHRPDSEALRSRTRTIYKKYAKIPDKEILEVLDSSSINCLRANVDDDWMIEHIFKSI